MINEEQEHFMKVAAGIASYAAKYNPESPFGAIVVKNGKIEGCSENYNLKTVDPCAHVEVLAIRDACRNLKTSDLSGCDLYTVTEPCPMCLAAIHWAQINYLYYYNTRINSTHRYEYTPGKNFSITEVPISKAYPTKDRENEAFRKSTTPVTMD